ncbi:hypothetical protein, conserved in T. vivax [Trypanosoma vivax Y486]|uniref:Uncharacterized protein n=1 Tax=Trypanosoma vivax (strain Y486) TaxID=1055687 RepID=F9WV33_TRYVY|nr:hypothetical protein, conserved in T. vivax [Trypanosoma vivax Y486]|eukprot:CCD21436.1 hypothetical protein, conserved in T. vivax [Trypanosoma vivax Y486]
MPAAEFIVSEAAGRFLASNEAREPPSHGTSSCGAPLAHSKSIAPYSAQTFIVSGPLGTPGDTSPSLFERLSALHRATPPACLDARWPNARGVTDYIAHLPSRLKPSVRPIPPTARVHNAIASNASCYKKQVLVALETCRGTLCIGVRARLPSSTRARPRPCKPFLQVQRAPRQVHPATPGFREIRRSSLKGCCFPEAAAARRLWTHEKPSLWTYGPALCWARSFARSRLAFQWPFGPSQLSKDHSQPRALRWSPGNFWRARAYVELTFRLANPLPQAIIFTIRSGKMCLHVLVFFVNLRPSRFALLEGRGSALLQCAPLILKAFLCIFECLVEIATPAIQKKPLRFANP